MSARDTQRLADLNYEAASRVIARGAWGLLPCGAVEAHGPHLPLATDVIIAEEGARRAVRVLAERGVPALVLPPLTYTVAEYAAEFAGTISISAEVMVALVRDVICAAVRTGIVGVVVCNAHLEPANIEALRAGVEAARALGARGEFPDVTKKPHALRLGEEFKSGACHAGSYETSLVLAAQPFVVDEEARAELPENPISLSRAIREGKRTFREAGGPRAYFGAPAAGSAAEGEALYRELAAIFASAVPLI